MDGLSEITCVLCLETPRAMHVFRCGHGGCAFCLVNLMGAYTACPECRAPITGISPVWPLIDAEKLTPEDRQAIERLKTKQDLAKWIAATARPSRRFRIPNQGLVWYDILGPSDTLDASPQDPLGIPWSALRNARRATRSPVPVAPSPPPPLTPEEHFEFLFNVPFPSVTRDDLCRAALGLAEAWVPRLGVRWFNAFPDIPSDVERTPLMYKIVVALRGDKLPFVPEDLLNDAFYDRSLDAGASLGLQPERRRTEKRCLWAVKKSQRNLPSVPLARVTQALISHQLHQGKGLPDRWVNLDMTLDVLLREPEHIHRVADMLRVESWMFLLTRKVGFRFIQNVLPLALRLSDEMTHLCFETPEYFTLFHTSVREERALKLLGYDPAFIFKIPVEMRTPALWAAIENYEEPGYGNAAMEEVD